jgi:Zn-dependent protease with chaperone function
MLSFGWWHYLVTLTVFVSASVMIIRWLPNMVSKKLEYKADEYAVRLLSNKELYVNTLIKIHELENDSCVFTSTKEWKETHPSLQKRISHLEKVFPSGENYG